MISEMPLIQLNVLNWVWTSLCTDPMGHLHLMLHHYVVAVAHTADGEQGSVFQHRKHHHTLSKSILCIVYSCSNQLN